MSDLQCPARFLVVAPVALSAVPEVARCLSGERIATVATTPAHRPRAVLLAATLGGVAVRSLPAGSPDASDDAATPRSVLADSPTVGDPHSVGDSHSEGEGSPSARADLRRAVEELADSFRGESVALLLDAAAIAALPHGLGPLITDEIVAFEVDDDGWRRRVTHH